MPDTDKESVWIYPTADQYEDWDAEADEMDMSTSEWIQAMVEAGRKKFDATVEPDETAEELRRQRNDLKEELEHARDRIQELENQLHRSERAKIIEFIENNPGATYGEIGQELADTVPERLQPHLDELEGREMYREDGEYYPLEDD